MNFSRRCFISLRIKFISIISFWTFLFIPSAQAQLPLELIKLPAGFQIDIYADGVPNARSMTISPSGIIYVGTRTEGNVYAVIDQNHDHKADQVIVIAKGLNMPNGVAFKDGDLYVAEVNRVLVYEDIDTHLRNIPKPKVLFDQLPDDRWHGWKYIDFGPDGKLYIPIGAPCNVCEKEDKRYSSISRIDPDGTNFEIFAQGVRNSVGFDWDANGDFWFSDNGRDNLGDNIPPDELNYAPAAGMHFGFPYCHGKGLADPEFGAKKACAEFTPAAQELGPHVAALGIKFYTGRMFPEDFQNQIFIAEHGSWNRSKKIGYRVTAVRLENNQPVQYKTFAEGWKQGEKVWGRPAALLIMPDGSMLVSDDHAGVIYRISYQP